MPNIFGLNLIYQNVLETSYSISLYFSAYTNDQWTVNGATLETGEHVRDHVVVMELNQELDFVTDLLLLMEVKNALVNRQSTKIVSMIIAQVRQFNT